MDTITSMVIGNKVDSMTKDLGFGGKDEEDDPVSTLLPLPLPLLQYHGRHPPTLPLAPPFPWRRPASTCFFCCSRIFVFFCAIAVQPLLPTRLILLGGLPMWVQRQTTLLLHRTLVFCCFVVVIELLSLSACAAQGGAGHSEGQEEARGGGKRACQAARLYSPWCCCALDSNASTPSKRRHARPSTPRRGNRAKSSDRRSETSTI